MLGLHLALVTLHWRLTISIEQDKLVTLSTITSVVCMRDSTSIISHCLVLYRLMEFHW